MGVELRASTTRMQGTITKTTDALFEITFALMGDAAFSENDGNPKPPANQSQPVADKNSSSDLALSSSSNVGGSHQPGFSSEVAAKLESIHAVVSENNELLKQLKNPCS